MEKLILYKKGNKIHIKKSHEGSFTEYCGGKVTDECIQKGKNSPNAKIRKRATFAQNARKWKHAQGGIIKFQPGGFFNNVVKGAQDIVGDTKLWMQQKGISTNAILNTGKDFISGIGNAVAQNQANRQLAEQQTQLQRQNQELLNQQNQLNRQNYLQQLVENNPYANLQPAEGIKTNINFAGSQPTMNQAQINKQLQQNNNQIQQISNQQQQPTFFDKLNNGLSMLQTGFDTAKAIKAQNVKNNIKFTPTNLPSEEKIVEKPTYTLTEAQQLLGYVPTGEKGVKLHRWNKNISPLDDTGKIGKNMKLKYGNF